MKVVKPTGAQKHVKKLKLAGPKIDTGGKNRTQAVEIGKKIKTERAGNGATYKMG